MIAGTLLVAAAVAWSINVWAFDVNSARGGHALLRQAAARRSQAEKTPATCSAPATSGATGVLEAPSIGLVAPVEQGLSDGVLAVAVGHDPSSVWPGSTGTAVLAAHDVSYFVNADRLRTGDVLRYQTACGTYDFTVTGHKVVSSGSPVYNSAAPSIVLVTCWPTDALWFTPDRLLVTAVETSAPETDGSAPSTASAADSSYAPPTVSAPTALVNEGLTLATNSIPMGAMAIKGTPSPTWVQSPAPLDVVQSAVEAYIGGIKATGSNQRSWWNAIAPGVQPPTPLVDATISTYTSDLGVSIFVTGSTPSTVTLETSVSVAGGDAPGAYAMSVRETLSGGTLLIASWQLAPT
jgi:sortase A